MKKTFLVLLAPIVFSIGLLVLNPLAVRKVSAETSSTCTASVCGTTEGTKEEPVYKEECDLACPTIHFEWTRTVYDSCPAGYSVRPGHEDQCKKDHNPEKGKIISRPSHTETYLADVEYNKSMDPSKCHRPSDHVLATVYKMDYQAVSDFKFQNSEWLKKVKVNCHDVLTGYETVSCNDAEIVPCAECPTECGYEGGIVEDAFGVQTECPATEACTTHMWCALNEDGVTYTAVEVVDGEENPEGKEYVDGMDESCVIEEIEEEEEEDTTDDDGEVLGEETEDKGEVLGESTVVVAETGPSSNVLVYIVEGILLALTSLSFVFFKKEYLKK